MDSVRAGEVFPERYDVFLSFRGEDIRKTFLNPLYEALVSSGFHTYKDDREIEKGENISSELEKVIKNSRSSKLVISKNYANSSWCLDELLMILECKRSNRQAVLPVFYHVDPFEVKNQMGSFADAFSNHERKSKEQTDEAKELLMEIKMRIWREALRDIADVGGMVLKDQNLPDFIEKVVQNIEDKLNRRIPSVAPYLVGVDSRVKDVNRWLQEGSLDVSIAAICGMSGIGKTTIAKYAFSINYERFGASSFLSNVRDVSEKLNGFIQLQKQLLYDLTGRKENIQCMHEGITKIKEATYRRRVLIVLDDVEKMEQKKVVENCGGLPLALQVLGSSLRGKSTEVWISAIKKLEEIPANQIHRKLKLSYDSLINDHDKNLFLDIACFFIGKGKGYVISILDGCGFYAGLGIQNLIDRYLLTIDKEKLIMHQMIRDMGREIVRQEWSRHPGRRSRLWNSKHSFNVLMEKTGTEAIEGLVLVQSMSYFNSLRNCYHQEYGDKSIMKCGSSSLFTRPSANISFIDSQIVKVETNAFRMINKLRLLDMDFVKLEGDPNHMPKNLRWLSWRRFRGKFIPKNFPMETLVAIDMRFSSLERAWLGTRFLPHLKILNLSHSHDLSKTPNFSRLVCLERLILKGCSNLLEVCESIRYLGNRLVFLNLKYCKRLKRLPQGICMLKILESLNIFGCSSLEEIPQEMWKLECLKEFNADDVPINPLPSTDRLNSSWNAVVRNWIVKPKKNIPQLPWTSLPKALVSLSLSSCNLTESVFPKEFGNLPFLQHINLTGNPLVVLPDCIKLIPKLEKLEMYSCNRLQAVTGLPKLKELGVSYCTSLEMITFQSKSCSPESYIIDGCEKLVYIEESFKLENICTSNMEIPDMYKHIIEPVRSIRVPLYNYHTHTMSKGPIKALIVLLLIIISMLFSMYDLSAHPK